MERQQSNNAPNPSRKFDTSPPRSGHANASGRDLSRPDRSLGFIPIDQVLKQGDLFDAAANPKLSSASGKPKPTGKPAFPKKPDPGKYRDKAPEDHDSEDVDEALEESFPASDPASYSPGTATPSNIKDKDRPRRK